MSNISRLTQRASTAAAEFIGLLVARSLPGAGTRVTGVDDLNNRHTSDAAVLIREHRSVQPQARLLRQAFQQ